MTENQKKLIATLENMFQFNQSDLDFGIYRIMSMKREEIKKFLEIDLPTQISEGIKVLENATNTVAIEKLENKIKVLRDSDIDEDIAKIIVRLEEEKKLLTKSSDISLLESNVYSHLTNFFSRYYDDGDFISQRRYKDGVYAIPYEGEEVKLHWANADQYYVKTSEYFKDYVFKTGSNDTVRFKIVEAETDKDNNKSTEKKFFQLHTENPFIVIGGELFIYIEYKNGGKKNQKECNSEIVQAFGDVVLDFPLFNGLLAITEKKSLLERQLDRYTARNTFDYFIHKDLSKFLNRELDFYIKNDVIFLDDIDEQEDRKTIEYLTKARVIRKIAKKIIAFLSQVEEFQKKLFLKKKFVIETNYCITLDRVPKSMYVDIISNIAQIDEWQKLFSIEDIVGDLTTAGYSNPLTLEFLEQNEFLVVDTQFFTSEFKEKLVESIDSLDANLDGLMIHSENFQALNLLQARYKERIKCVYIDPPYNTNATPIVYKNGYKDSSWLSLINDRYLLVKKLLPFGSIITTAIDHAEIYNLGKLLDIQFNPSNKIAVVTVQHNPKGRNQAVFFSENTEYLLVYSNEIKKAKFNDVAISEKVEETFCENDSIGKYRWESLIRARSSWGREKKPDNWYPIYIKKDLTEITTIFSEEYYEVFPVTNTGEYSWKYIKSSFNEINKNGEIKAQLEEDKVVLFHKYRENEILKNLWVNKKYQSEFNGTNLLKSFFGIEDIFSYPKSIYAVSDMIKLSSSNDGIILDYFAGSGTTGHAVINLNREDEGSRKYILCEMGEYFDTVTKPRIEKIIYSDTWKNGKPTTRKGSSHAFKYLRLESYEDALNNIMLSKTPKLLDNIQEEYLVSYMLNIESNGSDSLLNLDKLAKPFDYQMSITRNFESKNRNIDVIETFNYLIGLQVERSYALSSFDADFSKGEYGVVKADLKDGELYKIKMIEGKTLEGDSILIIWRELTGDVVKDNAVLDAFFDKKKISSTDFEYKKIYVNGDNNLENKRMDNEKWKVILIEEEMKKRMFEEV